MFGIITCVTIRSVWVSGRFAAVTTAQYKSASASSILATAYSTLALAHLNKTDTEGPKAAVAKAKEGVRVAEVAVKRAESRLPAGKSTRAYFARRQESSSG
jgi:IS5 family transposase